MEMSAGYKMSIGFLVAMILFVLVPEVGWDKGMLVTVAIPMLAVGLILLIAASARSVLIRTCRWYWIVMTYILFFPINRIITDARVGVDSGGGQAATLEIFAVFVIFVVGPIIFVHFCLLNSDHWSLPVMWSCFSAVFLFLVVNLFAELHDSGQNHVIKPHEGIFLESVVVSVGVPMMVVCAWLAHNKFRMKPMPSFVLGVGLLLTTTLSGTQVGFNKHPRDRMTYHYDDYGTVTLTYGPFESREDVIRGYQNGTKVGSHDGISWGDEDYNYFLAMNGLQLLLLTIPLGFGITLLLSRSSSLRR